MRISNSMIYGRVVFNMQRALSRFFDLQTQMSTGRRINKPSDDPVGIQRDLSYRTELAKAAQYVENIQQAESWMNNYDATLADAKDLISTAKEIAIAMANGTYDEVTRAGSAAEIDSIFDRLMQLGNSELEGRYVFSGYRTNDKALMAATNGVRYRGDSGQIDYQIERSSRMTVNLIGSDVFLKQLAPIGEEADLDVGLSTLTALADLHNGSGIDLSTGTFTITDLNMGITSTVDISAAATVGDVITAINAQLAADGITNLEAKLGPEGNNLFLDTTETGLISASTALERLNSGNGVDLVPGTILVTDGAGTNVNIDLSGSSTVGDVITAFNQQMADAGFSQVTMGLNAAGTGLEITDASGTSGFRVEDISADQSTAQNLGISGEIGPVLTGKDLHPLVAFEVAEAGGTTAADLGILASIGADFAGEDLDPRLLATSTVADLNHGLGIEGAAIIINHGELSRSVNLADPGIVTVQDVIDAINNTGLDITASINPDGRGIQIENNDSTRSLTVQDEANSRLAKDLGLWGAADVMGTVLQLGSALRANDQEGTGLLLKNLDDGIQHLLNHRASVGARAIRLESTHTRLVNLQLSFTELLSEVEDADLTELATDLATHENNYKSSLMASASIIQPSLLDFLS